MNTINISELPETVQEQVKSTLTAYDRAYVTRENGQFTYTAGLSLDTRVKAPDFKTFEIKKEDVYSAEEQAAHRAELYKRNPDGSHWTDFLND